MIPRRRFLVTTAAGLLAAPLAAEAEPAGKVYRIGMLWTTVPDRAQQATFDAFKQGLREQGYGEGPTVVFEHRYARGNYERLYDLAAELVRLKVDVIVTGNTQATLAAKEATRTIPIIFGSAGDPVASGL